MIELKDFNLKIISGEEKSSLDTWAAESKKFFQYSREQREQYGFKWHQFEHLGLKLWCSDVPFSWRVLSNSTNGIYQWEFHDEIGYPMNTVPCIDRYINEYNAKTVEEAIALFKQKVISIETGLDRMKKYD